MAFLKLKPVAFTLAGLVLASSALAAPAAPWSNLGRPATPAEVQAWDIDVRGDLKGLPKGSGSVQAGEMVWERSCASCHGTFAESNEVFTPLVGGTTDDDIKTGRVAALRSGEVPQRTTMMKLSKISTMWDYINRAMPWNAPKSLTTDEVYAVTAYILSLSNVVPGDFTLSDKNMAEVQKRLPNRNGMVRVDDMWKTNGKGDVKNVACMKDCTPAVKVSSDLPDYARNAHGNLAEQNRLIGPARGTNTEAPAGAKPAAAAPKKAAAAGTPPAVLKLLSDNSCVACHGMKDKLVGPGFSQIADKYKGKADAAAYLKGKIKAGSSGVWGNIPMPPQAQLKDGDAQALADWLAKGAH